ncbi:MAG: glycosyltransferase family 2 protein [candidate division FCPU426 bacterium]
MTKKPRVSIVVPALNEEITIGEFVDWCKEGLRRARVTGEILIIDSSTDRTPRIAAAHGARVVKVSKRGLGQAYIDALPHIRGEYVIMGDCDLTYDFREIGAFVRKLEEGFEFVIGSRLRGRIEPGAMPGLHRYFGTPLTTWILNSMYGSHYSDIHCGLRAMRTDALRRLHLESRSWEYASEMVLKAAQLKLKTAEIPIAFYKDREGRASHHKRSGWLSPWLAGWINLKVMFLYFPSFFLKGPGAAGLVLGLLLFALLALGATPLRLGPLALSVHSMFLAITLAVVGYAAFQMSVLAEMILQVNPERTERYIRFFAYNRGVLAGVLLVAAGLFLLVDFSWEYVQNGFTLRVISKSALAGLLSLILGFQTFTFTLVVQLLAAKLALPEPAKTGARP